MNHKKADWENILQLVSSQITKGIISFLLLSKSHFILTCRVLRAQFDGCYMSDRATFPFEISAGRPVFLTLTAFLIIKLKPIFSSINLFYNIYLTVNDWLNSDTTSDVKFYFAVKHLILTLKPLTILVWTLIIHSADEMIRLHLHCHKAHEFIIAYLAILVFVSLSNHHLKVFLSELPE